MRLIDADALKRSINSSDTDEKKVLSTKQLHEALVEWIDGRATIDAVEVVRCEDCRRTTECHKSVQYTRHESNSVTIGYSPIEWCSRGERKEE